MYIMPNYISNFKATDYRKRVGEARPVARVPLDEAVAHREADRLELERRLLEVGVRRRRAERVLDELDVEEGE